MVFNLHEDSVRRGESNLVLINPLTFQVQLKVVRASAPIELCGELVLTSEVGIKLARNILWDISFLTKVLSSLIGEILYSFKESIEMLLPALITICSFPFITFAALIVSRSIIFNRYF